MEIGRDDRVERRRPVDHPRGARVDQLLVPYHAGELRRYLHRDLVPHHHRMALRVRLGDDRQKLAWPRIGQPECVTHDPLYAGARHQRYVGRRFDRMSLMDAAADAGVFAFGVLANDYPVEVVRPAALEGAIDAGKDPGGTHIGVLVETLADLQPQTPQRDVVGNVRVARRTEEDRILVAQRVEAVVGHHHAVRAVVVAAPAEILEFKGERAVGGGERFKQLLSRGNDFLADAVAGNCCDTVGFHCSFRAIAMTSILSRQRGRQASAK